MSRKLVSKYLKCLAICILLLCSQCMLRAQVVDSVHYGDELLLDTIAPPPAIEETPYEDDEYGEDEYEEDGLRPAYQPYDSFVQKEEARGYVLRSTPSATVETWKKMDAFWYADSSFASERKPMRTKSKSGGVATETLLTVLAVVVFAALLVLFLDRANGLPFRRNRAIKRDDINQSEIPEDIFAIEYEKEIHKAESSQDYRLATRLHFLYLLKEMSSRNIIRYQDELTNLDYMTQLHGTTWYEDFFRLTRYFEYSWYGMMELDAGQYTLVKNDFNKMYKRFY